MVTYTDKLDGLDPSMLEGFFVGWPVPPSGRTHYSLLTGSDHVILAKDEGMVIGFVTALTDGVLSAYMPFLEVLPSHQKQGIGKELVRLMLMKLKDCYMVDLVCDPDLRPFYLSLGFTAHTAMIRRDYGAVESANARECG